jgi:DNA-binding beta-propeller fold protein YncE
MTKKLIILTALLGIFVIFLSLSCCKDCPDCPTEPEPEPETHYRLYSSDSYNNILISIDVPADTIVDSVHLDYLAMGVFVIPGGNRLLVKRYDNDSGFGWMEVYDASDFSHLGSIEQYGDYYFDGGDNYGIWITYEAVYFVNPQDLSPVDSITFDLPSGVLLAQSYLDTTSDQYFCRTSPFVSGDSTVRIYQIDCQSQGLVDSVITPVAWGRPVDLAYNWLTNDLYFQAFDWYGSSYFHQYDLTSDSLISTEYIGFVSGSIAVSPDGKRIYMTDGGDPFHGEFSYYPIWIFDALTHQPTHWIPPYDSSGWIYPYFEEIIPTPDNKRLYICGSGSAVPAIVVDLEEYKIMNTIDPYADFGSAIIALGPVPQN